MSFTLSRLATCIAVSLTAASGAALATPSLCDAGPPTYNGTPGKVWEGDFDGDRKPDRPARAIGRLKPDLRRASPAAAGRRGRRVLPAGRKR